jgi:hypothetical protein
MLQRLERDSVSTSTATTTKRIAHRKTQEEYKAQTV